MTMTNKYLMLSAILGMSLSVILGGLLLASHQRNRTLEQQVLQLEGQLSQPTQARLDALQMAGPGVASSPVDRMVKDLSTRFVGDPRSLSEKLRDFMAEHPDPGHLAVASKVVVDLAENRDALADQELIWLYQQPMGDDLKRVIAQVLSARGDNHLLDAYVAPLATRLSDPMPDSRRSALGELAKTRYAGAADMIAPSLSDSDPGVLLDALLALRQTGNESHLGGVKPLQNHPDESVRWLAGDVVGSLELLSKKARRRVNLADIVAELPVISPEMQQPNFQ